MTDKTYNGWTNYATWRVNLELFDGLNIREDFDELPDANEIASWARDYAESLVEECLHPDAQAIVHGWAYEMLRPVDWHMIARHLIENASEVDA